MLGICSTLILFVLTLFPVVFGQFALGGGGGGPHHYAGAPKRPDFDPNDLTVGLLATFCTFAFFFLICLGWCSASLVWRTHGHRTPYAMLLGALVFSLIATSNNIACTYYFNISLPRNDFLLAPHLDELLQATSIVATPLSDFFLLSSINAVLRNRCNALPGTKDRGLGGRNPLAHKLLAIIMLILGIAGAAVYVEALVENYTAMTALAGQNPPIAIVNAINDKFLARDQVHVNLGVAFAAFVVLCALDVAISVFRLRNAVRLACRSDKITEQLGRTVAPLYALYSLCRMIFTIISLKVTPAYEIVRTLIEGEALANHLLLLMSFSAVIFTLLLLSINPEDWVITKKRDHQDRSSFRHAKHPWSARLQVRQVDRLPHCTASLVSSRR